MRLFVRFRQVVHVNYLIRITITGIQLQDSNAYFQCQNKLLNEEINNDNIKQTKIRVVSNELADHVCIDTIYLYPLCCHVATKR